MKFIIYFLLTISCLVAKEAKSEKSNSGGGGGNFGLGITFLGPTGITAKYRMDEKKAIEASLGFGELSQYGNWFHLHGVFLYNFHTIDQVNFYIGGGLALFSHRYRERENCRKGYCIEDREVSRIFPGIRAPVGVSWMPNKQFELSAELYMHLYLVDYLGAGVVYSNDTQN